MSDSDGMYTIIRCGYCKGMATAVTYSPLLQFHLCKDMGLCEKIRVYEAMLSNVRSA